MICMGLENAIDVAPVDLPRGKELIRPELGKLSSTEHRLSPNDKRGTHFRVAMLGRVQIHHELPERALESRELPLQHHEARARELRGGLEIHQAHRLAELIMLLRGGEVARVAEAALLDIAMLVLADG